MAESFRERKDRERAEQFAAKQAERTAREEGLMGPTARAAVRARQSNAIKAAIVAEDPAAASGPLKALKPKYGTSGRVIADKWIWRHPGDWATVSANAFELKELGARLRLAGGNLFAECQVALYQVAEEIKKDAVAHASVFSTRIPPTIHVRGTRGLNVVVAAGGPRAPHAKPIENHGDGYVIHPVFGDHEAATDLNSHPAYLQPALEKHEPELAAEISAAATRAIEGV